MAGHPYMRILSPRAMQQVQDQMKKDMEREPPDDYQQSIDQWEKELKRLQALATHATNRETIKSTEIPALQAQIKQEQAKIPSLSNAAEEVSGWMLMYTLVCLIYSADYCETERSQAGDQRDCYSETACGARLCDVLSDRYTETRYFEP